MTIAALSSRSGVSNGSIYHHFGSREEVLRKLLVGCFAELMACISTSLDDRPAEQCLRSLVGAYLDWVAAHPGKAAVIYGVPLAAGVMANHGNDVLAAKGAAAAPVSEWMRERRALGEIRSIPDWAADPVAFGPLHEVCRRGLAGSCDPEVVADAFWAIHAPPLTTPAPAA